MPKIDTITLDLHFQDTSEIIASYLIPYSGGGILIESGPGSTINHLVSELNAHGFDVSDITDLLVTHIHLDHAGASGWLAQQGVRVHVHPVGAPHMIEPERLLKSAKRIYGEAMDELWGAFLPVPEEQLVVHEDGEEIVIGEIKILALDTPGHAFHHFSYLIGQICFSGDIGGVRLPGPPDIRVPMPPPEFHLEKWRESASRLKKLEISHIAPTHFGIYDDIEWYLQTLARELDAVEEWIEEVMPREPSLEELQDKILTWAKNRSIQNGIDDSKLLGKYELVNPTWMAAAGVQRYWEMYRQG